MMQEKLIQYLLPIVCVVLMAVVAAVGGAGWGWSRGVASEQAKLMKERAGMAQREKDVAKAESEWAEKVAAESAKFKEASESLAAARVLIDQIGDNTHVEVRKVATDRQCISPATARLLDASITKANARLAAARSPGVLVAAATATAPVAAPELDNNLAFPDGLTEREIAEYLNDVRTDYEVGSRLHNTLIDKLRASPLIKVVPDNRSL